MVHLTTFGSGLYEMNRTTMKRLDKPIVLWQNAPVMQQSRSIDIGR